MKRILMIAALFALAGCKSAKKNSEISEAQKTPPAPVAKETKVEKKAANEWQYTCMVKGDKRIVELKKDNGRCEIHYTKFGNSEQVAWGQATPSICSDVYDKIRSNIEEKGFKCQSAPAGVAAK